MNSLQSVDSLRFELDKKDREIKYLNDTYLISIDGWNYELEKKNQIIAKLNREIFEKDREISELKRKLDTDRLITDTNNQSLCVDFGSWLPLQLARSLVL